MFSGRALVKISQRLSSRATVATCKSLGQHRTQVTLQTSRAPLRPQSKEGLFQHVQARRHYRSPSAGEAKQFFRNHPVYTTLGTLCLLMTCGSMYYVYWFNKHYIVGAFKAFPDPVAKKLRRALYYSNISESPKDAVRYYREALAVAEQVGMDPYSDEVIGIKVQLAAFLEKINQIQQSIAILNLTRDECLKWFEEGKGREEGEARRRRMLRKLVGMSVKIGELCQHYYVQSPEMAQRNFDWAVTSALMAKNRQDEEKVETEAGTWLTEEEIGATLEAAATFYSQIGQSHLAAPLFLEAIELCPKSDCNVVYLMNGLAVALASNTPSQEAGTHAPDRAVMIDSARQWANKALELAGNIKPPDRTEKCDTGCATVVQNLGQMAESEGNLAEARRRFEEAKSLSKAISHKVGVDLATESLARLDEAADVKDNT